MGSGRNNPADLVTPELIDYCKQFTIITVAGFTKTGKYTIAKKLADALGRHLIVSDDFGLQNFEDFRRVSQLAYVKRTPVVIEGVMTFRLLRKGLEENNFHTDLIIKTNCNESTIRYFYEKEGEGDKINRVLSFNKGLNTMWDEYRASLRNDLSLKRPIYMELNTSI